MNRWWLVFVPLGCLWALPMLGVYRAGAPWFFFAAMGAFWALLLVFAPPLYEAGTQLVRSLGMKRFAAWRDELEPTILPPVRAALAIAAIISFAFAAS